MSADKYKLRAICREFRIVQFFGKNIWGISTRYPIYFWRRRRDSNSRTAFDGYTISNRARSTSYATSPCLFAVVAVRPNYNIIKLVFCQYFFGKFSNSFSAFLNFGSKTAVFKPFCPQIFLKSCQIMLCR